MDLVVQCRSLPRPGETVLAESSTEVCGGKGANQAVAAARAGGRTAMIGRIGGDSFAERLRRNLEQELIQCEHILATPQSASGLAVVAVDQRGENSIIVVPGANAQVSANDVRSIGDMIGDYDVMLTQLETPVETAVQAIGIARAAGVRVIVDPAPAPSSCPNELLSVDLVCPNETEAATLSGQPVESIDQAESAAKIILQRGARAVAVTMGENGTLLCTGEKSTHVPSLPVTVRDTTAAGDAFAGALAVRWAESCDLEGSIPFASAAGALAASKAGAQPSLPHREEIDRFLSSQT